MTAALPPLGQANQDYERIAIAIQYMRENYRSQPDLATIAQQVHLSDTHFQRLFTRWAGISPKRFLQYLTVEYAKAKLHESRSSLLDLAWDVGLSSPGRLHDLFVKLEAMSPGEYKAHGAGLCIRYGLHNTPFGLAMIATTPRGVCALQFIDSVAEAIEELRYNWAEADIQPDNTATVDLCDQIFDPSRWDTSKPLTVLVKGTNFQIQVWRSLLRIPSGNMTTYRGIAQAMSRPTAARAVGNAVGQNPIAYLIPCHRVIRESGELGGYRWGLSRKAAMLGWEASQSDCTPGGRFEQ
ncbi:bifunctional helix-turn-helix domain-containing protein/methylated-DNA--[protein]-cysteine S-methyltransferase [Leptolyngbya sp. AN02str]|uniref:bifunctional helix-turn-helix domain-containing protein/methylated-DNA--[protein]-cysteine S-methyltransferase n=1 Tax=Leptolyngbya sp. AN02str TaxID=3423363 RepID=UPI003D31581A